MIFSIAPQASPELDADINSRHYVM